jgi:hypothetical protein
MKKVKKARKSMMLIHVNKHFPKVTRIKDADKALAIEVTANDEKYSKRKDHEQCAMAVACKRAYHADGVIIARSIAYLIKGDVAVRFRVPERVSREIISFDRGAGFNPGIYELSIPVPSDSFEYRQEKNLTREDRSGHTGGKKRTPPHHTKGIRTILGSDHVD